MYPTKIDLITETNKINFTSYFFVAYLLLPLRQTSILSGNVRKGKVHPCTGTEALYRPYGP